jgi:hypothetical protein
MLNPLRTLGCAISLAAVVGLAGMEAAIGDPKGWNKVYTDKQSNLTYHLDRGTIKGTGRYRYFWLFMNEGRGRPLGSSKNGKAIHGVLVYLSVDCQNRAARIRSTEIYDRDNQRVEGVNDGDAGVPVVVLQNQTGTAIMRAACR